MEVKILVVIQISHFPWVSIRNFDDIVYRPESQSEVNILHLESRCSKLHVVLIMFPLLIKLTCVFLSCCVLLVRDGWVTMPFCLASSSIPISPEARIALPSASHLFTMEGPGF